MEEKEILKEFGCEEIQYTNLINNYYINFKYNQKGYTAEHILNVYGAEVDMWMLTSLHSEPEYFKTLEELLNHIKSL